MGRSIRREGGLEVKLRRIVYGGSNLLKRHPWLPAAVYFVLYGLVALTYFVAVANLIPARYRLWEELDKSELAVVAKVGTAVLRIMVVYALLLLIVPLFFLVIRTARRIALRVFGFGIVTIVFSIVLALMVAPIIYVGSMELGLAEQENDEIEEIRDWTNSTECGSKNDYQYPKTRYQFVAHEEDKGVYDLFDRRVRRVVIKDVVRWEERDERLRFVTRDGMKYFMDYSEGRIRRYPDPEWVYSKSKKDDAIFKRLKAE